MKGEQLSCQNQNTIRCGMVCLCIFVIQIRK